MSVYMRRMCAISSKHNSTWILFVLTIFFGGQKLALSVGSNAIGGMVTSGLLYVTFYYELETDVCVCFGWTWFESEDLWNKFRAIAIIIPAFGLLQSPRECVCAIIYGWNGFVKGYSIWVFCWPAIAAMWRPFTMLNVGYYGYMEWRGFTFYIFMNIFSFFLRSFLPPWLVVFVHSVSVSLK